MPEPYQAAVLTLGVVPYGNEPVEAGQGIVRRMAVPTEAQAALPAQMRRKIGIMLY